MDEKSAALAFSLSPIGPKGFQNLIKVYGSSKKAWKESSPELYAQAGIGEKVFAKLEDFQKAFNVIEYQERLKKTKVEFVAFSEEEYPKSLKKLPNPPIGLFIKGNKKLLSEKNNLGVVGTRKMTSYGAHVTESIVSELANSGLVITSGMAMGVDACAHKAAMSSEGATIAILGCGVDCPYPRENEKLYHEIIASGGLVMSEYPLRMQANKGTFPARNRLIAALSIGILVTEAGVSSGSLITADIASKLGKPVFAVPGPITSQVAKGSISLLKNGAVLATSADDIVGELEIKVSSRKFTAKLENAKFNKDEMAVIKSIEGEGKTTDEIANEAKIPLHKLVTVLSGMEILGIAKNRGGKWELVN